jgi:hypothetical protein
LAAISSPGDWAGWTVEYFASIREPIAQLLSMLNWHFEISHREPEWFLAHSAAAQRTIAEVQATNFLSYLLSWRCFWSLTVLSSTARPATFSVWILPPSRTAKYPAGWNSYCYIATEQTLPDLYQAFGFAEIPRYANEHRENAASKYHFDTTIFKTPELRAFLAYHHRHDIALYDLVRQTSGSAQRRHPFRPAFEITTPENYDEQAYVDANPDVAAAIRANGVRSGRDHFDAFGHAEGRRQLRPPSFP